MAPQASAIEKTLIRVVHYSSRAQAAGVGAAALARRRVEGEGAAAAAAPEIYYPGPVRDSAAAAAWAFFSEDRPSHVRGIHDDADPAPAGHLDTLIPQIFRAATTVCACVVVSRDPATAHLVVALTGGCSALEEQTLLLTFIIPPPTIDAAVPVPPASLAMSGSALPTPAAPASCASDSLIPTAPRPEPSTAVVTLLEGHGTVEMPTPPPASQPPLSTPLETASSSHTEGPMPETSSGERTPLAPHHTLVCANNLQFRVASIASDPGGAAIVALVDGRSVPAARPGSIRVLPWPLRQRRAPEEDY